MTKTIASLAILSFGLVAHADGLRYGQTVRVNGQPAQVISQRPTNGYTTIETRVNGRSQTYSVTKYDQVFRTRLDSPKGHPSFVLPKYPNGRY